MRVRSKVSPVNPMRKLAADDPEKKFGLQFFAAHYRALHAPARAPVYTDATDITSSVT
jgi:hypothetical protein